MAPGFRAGSRLLISPTFRACHVIDVYRRETALVVTRVPERQLLALAPHRTCRRCRRSQSGAGLHRRVELIDHEPRRGSCSAKSPAGKRLIATPARSGHRPTVSFIKGSCRSRSRSIAFLYPHAIADTRSIISSRISHAGHRQDRDDPASPLQVADRLRRAACADGEASGKQA
jgi:hypothetical protein